MDDFSSDFFSDFWGFTVPFVEENLPTEEGEIEELVNGDSMGKMNFWCVVA
jgi:hypothetical protein